MAREFTAEEMREMALVEESYGWDAVAKMLCQAADMMECEEKREKKYEYGVLPCGINFVYQTRAEAEHKQTILEQSVGFKYPIVRREVGEWEEVK